jgi:hypothetical protein
MLPSDDFNLKCERFSRLSTVIGHKNSRGGRSDPTHSTSVQLLDNNGVELVLKEAFKSG